MTQDLVVVSFRRDIPLLNLFVKSVDRFVSENLFENFWLIITDDTPVEKFKSLANSKFKWKTVYAKDLFDTIKNHEVASYIDQQIAKLKISELILSEWYWVFDSKNFLLKNINQSNLYKDEKALVFVRDTAIWPPWEQGHRNTEKYFNIGNHKFIANSTPYPVYSSLVRELISGIENFELTFKKLFLNDHICEFYFYNGYVIQQKKFEDLYLERERYQITVWTTNLDQEVFSPDNIKQNNLVWCGGLHYDTIRLMDNEWQQKWAEFLTELGFFSTFNEAIEWFQQV